MASKPPEDPAPVADEEPEIDPIDNDNDVPNTNTDPWVDGP